MLPCIISHIVGLFPHFDFAVHGAQFPGYMKQFDWQGIVLCAVHTVCLVLPYNQCGPFENTYRRYNRAFCVFILRSPNADATINCNAFHLFMHVVLSFNAICYFAGSSMLQQVPWTSALALLWLTCTQRGLRRSLPSDSAGNACVIV